MTPMYVRRYSVLMHCIGDNLCNEAACVIVHGHRVHCFSTFSTYNWKCVFLLHPTLMQCTVDNAIEDILDFIETTSATLNVTGRTAAPLVVIGGGCPVKTDTIAKLSKFLHAVQVW